jgi:hypothetical protein
MKLASLSSFLLALLGVVGVVLSLAATLWCGDRDDDADADADAERSDGDGDDDADDDNDRSAVAPSVVDRF